MTDDLGPARRYLQEEHAKQQPQFTRKPPAPKRTDPAKVRLMPFWLFAAVVAFGAFIIDPIIGRAWGILAGLALITIVNELWRKHRRRRASQPPK